MTNIGIILAGGKGERFNGGKPKQYCLLNGKEVIAYSIDAFKKSQLIDDFVVVLNEDEYNNGRVEHEYGVKTTIGGRNLNESKKAGLDFVKANFPLCGRIIMHSSACPLITPSIIDTIIGICKDKDCVQCAYKITDALFSYQNRKIDREQYYTVQSPECLSFPKIYECFDPEKQLCSTAAHLPDSAVIENYWDFLPNIKITYPYDIKIAEMLLNEGYIK